MADETAGEGLVAGLLLAVGLDEENPFVTIAAAPTPTAMMITAMTDATPT
jgi:hypothetical protein